ncbi:FCD domain-containing protein [Psychrobacillus sp. FJAT-51614]|uniref:FCD domain-containing protein n=1 Tax=Psychrobacillus mangrovi TaxID=3117745 RepID=A0ABU8F9Y5_9BACI
MKILYHRLYEQVITYIQQGIKEGRFSVGERIPAERQLAEELGVSRGTLRDAFRILESKNIIKTRQGGGRVLMKPIEQLNSTEDDIMEQLKKAEILELLEARELLEVGMCELVCERISDDDIEELEVLLKNQADNLSDLSYDFYFHLSITAACQNRVLENFIKLNMKLIQEIREKNFMIHSNYQEAHEEHWEILNAIKKRDVELCKEAVKNHFRNIKVRLNLT